MEAVISLHLHLSNFSQPHEDAALFAGIEGNEKVPTSVGFWERVQAQRRAALSPLTKSAVAALCS
jgi:hypothetical protein